MRIPNSFKVSLLAVCFFLPLFCFAQGQKPLPNWQNLDLKTDGMFGISTEKAYKELLKDKKHTPVLVAVIDGGVDIEHEDLKKVIWTNPNEIEGNKADDDKNGYVDDVHGWDFIGSAKGDVRYDNLELTRLLRPDYTKYKYADPKNLRVEERAAYAQYQKLDKALDEKKMEAQTNQAYIEGFIKALDLMIQHIHIKEPSFKDLFYFIPQSPGDAWVRKVVLDNYGPGDFHDFLEYFVYDDLRNCQAILNYQTNINFESRDTVGDNYADINEHYYGNNDVTGPDADHGTHVSGIIGAVRDNDLGVKGVANDVMIMSVRTVPDGDERDKDVANAIRYAVNNGAKVINMSFGKDYSPNKKAVDDAVKYAMSKDVLMVHATGNDNKNKDTTQNYPNPVYEDNSGTAAAWIEVGAAGFKDDENLKASFSNYGKNTVDVFAPGMRIVSTAPGSKYREHDGTSMAAPVVTGLAALIRSYYPNLTAVQVKEIIMKSVTKVNHKVIVKIDKSTKSRKVPFEDLCKSGGIVNAYEALKLAATY